MSARKDMTTGMKSAYELALERMERQGIEPPRAERVSEELRRKMEEVRTRARAKLAELEILHRHTMRKLADPAERRSVEEDYRRERRGIESERDRRLEELRHDA